MSREFDIAVFGASGFTGKLAAERLAHRAKSDPPRRVALAGRDLAKLGAVNAEIGGDFALLKADAADETSLAELAGRARVG